MDSLNLNGSWEFRFEENKFLEDIALSGFVPEDIMSVPGCFDATPAYYCKRGTALYRKTFRIKEDVQNAFLCVEGMGLRTRFLLDGREIGFSALPYSYLEFETGPLAAGDHVVEAAVDNCFDAEKVKLFMPYFDFYAFGGFYHGVSLKIQKKDAEPDRVRIRILDYRTGRVELEFQFKGNAPAEFNAEISFDAETARTYHISGNRLELSVPDPRPWSPESPVLHTLFASVNNSTVSERFGLRKIEVKEGRILLNGKAIYLKGFNRHESHPEFGSATPEQLMLEDLQNLRKLHCNFVRGCHYPQSRRFLDLCDEFGILVWEESLGWGNTPAQMADPEYIRLQIEQTKNMVRTSFNHPSIVIFAFQNENASQSEEGKALNGRLVRAIREENSGRLITFACNQTSGDISNEETDLIAYNTYPGWINTDSAADPMKEFLPDREKILHYFHSRYGTDKPIIVSEMGTCGVYGQHDAAAAQWTEEFQAEYLRNVIETVFGSPDICGLCIWQFTDAKSYLRSRACIRVKPFAQNLAGVFDGYRRPKLAAGVVEELYGAHE